MKKRDLNMSSDEEEKPEGWLEDLSFDALVIDHTSTAFTVWTFFINILSIATGFVYAHFAAYRHQDPLFSETFMVLVELLYLFDMMMRFVLSYPDPRGTFYPPVKDLDKCKKHYLHGDFASHFIPMLPLQWLRLSKDR